MRVSKIFISLAVAFPTLSIFLFSCSRVAPLPGDVMVSQAIDAAALRNVRFPVMLSST